MKRKLFCIIISLTLAIISVFSVGCANSSQLEFNGSYCGYQETKDATGGYVETLTYTITESNDYKGNYNLSPNVDEDIFTCSYSNGTYTSTLQVHGTIPQSAPKEVVDSDIIPSLNGMPLYQLDTSFSIDVTYSLNKQAPVTTTDTIKTTTYFCPAKLSFAPIYSYTHSVNNLFSIGSSSSAVATRTLTNTVCYDKETFVSKTQINDEAQRIVTKEYDFRTVVDNTQLLFVMRNLKYATTNSSLSVVQFSYNDPVSLSLTSKSDSDVNLTIQDYKGQSQTDTVNVKTVSFIVTDTTAPGMYQYAEIQNSKSANDKFLNNALLTSYAHTLYADGVVGYYKVLVYTLQGVNIVNPS